MAAPITCVRNDWTQIAPPGFEHLMFRHRHGALRIETSAGKPTNPKAGIAITAEDVRNAPFGMFPLRTGSVGNAVWARPDGGDSDIVVELLF